MLQFMGWQRVGHDLVNERQQQRAEKYLRNKSLVQIQVQSFRDHKAGIVSLHYEFRNWAGEVCSNQWPVSVQGSQEAKLPCTLQKQ